MKFPRISTPNIKSAIITNQVDYYRILLLIGG